MPASPPYIPPRNADRATWLDNFATLIAASPATYGLSSADATAISNTNADWQDAYSVMQAGTTRGPMSIAAFDAQNVITLALIRPYAQQIANNAGVSVDDKIALGLNARTNPPAPIAAPTTWPVLSIVSALPLQHVLRARDDMSSPSVKAKPYGVIAMQLFGMASATAVTDPTTLPLVMLTTKVPFAVNLSSADAGKQMYYAAKWYNRNGLVGPYGPIVNFTIANGTV